MATADDTANEIQKLYDISAALDANIDQFTSDPKYEAMYDDILEASKGGQKAKMLAAQFIPKYLKYFPKFADKSINSLIDLCEDEDLSTRVSAIRALPSIAKITPESLPKLADILGQLLQAELPVELDRVKQSLVSLLQQDLKGTLNTLFTQAASDIEDLRGKAIAFIFEKVVPMRDELNATEDIQKAVAENIKKVLPHAVTAREFQLFTSLLACLTYYHSPPQVNEILQFYADVNADFDATDESLVAKFATYLQSATEFLQRGGTSEKFTEILSTRVLPGFASIKEQQQVDLLHKLTDVVGYMNANDAKALLPAVYDLLLVNLPAPAATAEAAEPKLNFSIIESTLYIFHILAAKAPGSVREICGINAVLTGQPSSMSLADKKKDLDERLKHLIETTSKNYVSRMEVARKDLLKATTPEDLQKKKLIEVSIKATNNILQLAQNLLSKSPSFGPATTKLVLSFNMNKPQNANKSTPKPPTPAPKSKLAAAPRTTSTTSITSTAPTATPTAAKGTTGARPAFGNVYVPPSRQSKKRPSTDAEPASSTAAVGTSGKAEDAADSPSLGKKHKGRGSSKFQGNEPSL